MAAPNTKNVAAAKPMNGGGVYYANTFTSSAIADSGIFASDDGGASWRAAWKSGF